MKIKFIFLLFIGVITNVCFSQTEITINSQTWSKNNLSVSKFRNGDEIKQVKTLAEFNAADGAFEPAWMHYLYNPANDAKYGKIYNWWAVVDDRGLAPEGWHIPSEKEWEILFCSYSNGDRNPPKSLGNIFSCQFFSGEHGSFAVSQVPDNGGHWSTTRIDNTEDGIYTVKHLSYICTNTGITSGLSVICIKDKVNTFNPKVDLNNTKTYPSPIVLDNGQVWSTDYLKVTTFRNGDSIPEANEDWLWEKYIRDKKPAWCSSSRGKSWGILYNYYACIDPRGITPKGLRIPTGAEWGNSARFDIDNNVMTKKNISLWKIGNRTYDGSFVGNRPNDRLERKELGNNVDNVVWTLDDFSSSMFDFKSSGLGKPIICIYEY